MKQSKRPKATENIKLILLTLSGYYIKLYSLWITKDLGGFLSLCSGLMLFMLLMLLLSD